MGKHAVRFFSRVLTYNGQVRLSAAKPGTVSVFALCLCAVLLSTAAADTIVLKTGKRISAGIVVEESGRVSYETEDGRYTIPRSLVAAIEKGPYTAGASRVFGTSITLPPLPQSSSSTAAQVPLLASGELDRARLDELARHIADLPATDETARRHAGGIFLAAVDFEMRRGHTDSALALAQRGASVLPQDGQLLLASGVLLLHRQQVQAAREWLNRAQRAAPDSAQAWKFLGVAEYLSDRTGDAIRCWRRSLALAHDSDVEQMLARALRETSAEANFQQTSSSHFTLRFEGGQVAASFRQEILAALERHYLELDQQLDAALREPIPVILYTNQAYRDVTRAPAWAGAINDGRVRLPVDGLTSVTSELSRVLRHELVHSFVWAKTRGRCPVWLNEGLAQFLEGGYQADPNLARLWQTGHHLSWNALQQSFLTLDARMVPLAYAQSQAAVRFLAARYGLQELVRLLARLGEGMAPETALRMVYRLDYADLDRGVGDMLRTSN